jgi:hypothetical protein
MDILKELEELRMWHKSCEDNWYSCPMSADGCSDDREEHKCNCGAEEHNNQLDKIIAFLSEKHR